MGRGRYGAGDGSDSDWVAVDGEAEGNNYTLLCDSDGRSVYKWGGLSTVECFDFLLSASSERLCCFGLNYDSNNWLKDLHKDLLWQLWKHKKTVFVRGSSEYLISWIPGKEITIRKGLGKDCPKVNIVECYGFFQCSFEKACQSWGIPVPDEITKMKAKRGTFTKAERARVTAYCQTECMLLSDLMGKLQEQCERVDITPKKWIGSGQLGAALLERKGVAHHYRTDQEICPTVAAHGAILHSYFGGRVEAYAQGDFSPAFVYDINSAYPAAAMQLPSLKGARLERVYSYDPGLPNAIWYCHWKSERDLVTPFPTRRKQQIYYPVEGDGWYHAPEVRAAISAGHDIRVSEGWNLVGKSKARPFDWVGDVYAYRRDLKAKGDAGERVVKLALNSMYGKLAQGMGGWGGAPRWQSYYWAGKITAYTRAKLMELMARQTPLMVATDGLVFQHALPDVEDTDELGGWSSKSLEGFFVVQPGVYLAWEWAGEFVWQAKSRGFFAKEVDYHAMRKLFADGGPRASYGYKSRRFIGLGTALHRKDFNQWREWRDEYREINFMPNRRLPEEQPMLTKGVYLRPPLGPICSEVYTPKGSSSEPVSEDYLLGLEQPNIGAML
jgi:hypothetical protein